MGRDLVGKQNSILVSSVVLHVSWFLQRSKIWYHVNAQILLGGVNPIPNQADVENIAKSLRVTYELEDNLVDEENSFLFRITFHNTGNETLTYGNYSIYMYNIRLLQPIQSPYPNGYKLHDCSLWLHHVSGSLYRQGQLFWECSFLIHGISKSESHTF